MIIQPSDIPVNMLEAFAINQKGIRVMDVKVKTIDEIYASMRSRHLMYQVPKSADPHFKACSVVFGHNSPKLMEFETDMADFVMDLSLYLSKEKLMEILSNYPIREEIGINWRERYNNPQYRL